MRRLVFARAYLRGVQQRSSTHLRFVPHMHSGPGCVVCAAAAQPQRQRAVSKTTGSSAAKQELQTSLDEWYPCAASTSRPHANTVPEHVEMPATSRDDNSPFCLEEVSWLGDPMGEQVTVGDQKKTALLEGLDMLRRSCTPKKATAGACENDSPRKGDVQDLLQRFQQAEVAKDLCQEDMDALVDYYDSLTPTVATTQSLESKRTTISSQQSLRSEKQAQFSKVLLAFSALLDRCFIPHFLVCGTALGVVREQGFIEHDNDIDIGVFLNDLQAVGADLARHAAEEQGGAAIRECHITPEMGAKYLVGMLVLEAETAGFSVLDMIGEVDKGLELRFVHTQEGVLVDLNLYYKDTDLQTGEVFWWTATHYEQSAARKHGMYRYRHRPFLLHSVSFCGKEFQIPPQSYLVEYFGDDWRVPKKFSYKEGLTGEYKNIIEE